MFFRCSRRNPHRRWCTHQQCHMLYSQMHILEHIKDNQDTLTEAETSFHPLHFTLQLPPARQHTPLPQIVTLPPKPKMSSRVQPRPCSCAIGVICYIVSLTQLAKYSTQHTQTESMCPLKSNLLRLSLRVKQYTYKTVRMIT